MKLIVGLGNPGSEYEQTRHNIGFMVLDKLARELGPTTLVWENNTKFRAHVARVGEVILVKPQTFMNSSGVSVSTIVSFYKLKSTDVWVVCDDIDLSLGKVRIREKGGMGGHHGLESIYLQLATDKFVRFRLGIGRGKESSETNGERRMFHRSVVDFVLSGFGRGEAGSMKHLIKHGVEAIRIALTDGVDKAMNRFN